MDSPPEDDEIEEETLDLPGPPPAVYPVELESRNMDRDAVKVIRRLNRYGHRAYLVGGGVRDLLLGRAPKDFDVATSAKPQEVRRLFRNCRIIGRRFRLAHILFGGGKVIEVATFRRDPTQRFHARPYDELPDGVRDDLEAPVRLAPLRTHGEEEDDLLIRNDNVFGHPHEDSVRRDFTINGLFFDLERSEVIDYVGGMPDLKRRVVRTIGDPDVRFREDPVRILRAIKFSARIDMGIDPDVYDALVEYRGELARAARPRLLEELFRLMRGGAAHRSIYLAWDLGVLAELLPEVASFLDDDAPGTARTWGRLRAIDDLHADGQLPSDAVLIAALLLGPLEEILDGARDPAAVYDEVMEDAAFRLALPRRIKERVRLVVTAQRRLRQGKLGSVVRRDYFEDAATLFALDQSARDEEIPDWAQDPQSVSEAKPRRRRRRRRRRGND
ncbi:MAG: poly(A) polymerase [Sandaracinus sp.]|nr:poly(A) polymerase [Sandaracinus sp.]